MIGSIAYMFSHFCNQAFSEYLIALKEIKFSRNYNIN